MQTVLKEMYMIENQNAERMSYIFKNIDNGNELIVRGKEELEKYGKKNREDTIRL